MKKILIHIAQLAEGHRAAIASAAKAHGYEAVFRDDIADALAEAADAEIIFSQAPALPGAAPMLKWLCLCSAGANLFLSDDVYANPKALLSNSSGAYGVTIAEFVVMLTLTMMRRQMEYGRATAQRQWPSPVPIRSIKGCRVTMLGAGDIGRETASRLRAFGPECIVALNRSGRNAGEMFDKTLPVSALDEILPETDLLVMSLPSTDETRGIMDERRLALLPKDAFLVNVGRGSAIDEDALVALMQGGHLAGAALDVFVQEPLPPQSPLWDCPRLLVTPHIAGNMNLGYTVDRIVAMFLEDFENYCAGKPLKHLVDRKKGY